MPPLIPRDIDKRFADALKAEFLGTLLLQFLASLSGTSLGYGLAYTVTRHLNPALTLATVITGHVHWIKGLGYIITQITGAIVGTFLEAVLVPGLRAGHNAFRAPAVRMGASPDCPLALGLTIWVAGEAGGTFTGAAMNPARVIASSIVFLCTPQKKFWLYMAGEFSGAIIAAAFAAGHFGIGLTNATGRSSEVPPFLEEANGTNEPLLAANRQEDIATAV